MLANYFDDVISRDIVQRHRLRKPDKLKILARYYLTNTGSRISFNRLKKILKMPVDTVERFSYWKSKTECDFVIRTQNKIDRAIQVCCELTPGVRERELKGLLQAMEEFELETGTVITRDYESEEQHQGKTIRFTPLWQWLCNQ